MRNERAFYPVLALALSLLSALHGTEQIATSYPPVIQGNAGQSQSVAVDAAGNRYVVGDFSGTRDFNPGPGLDVKGTFGSSDAFVTRFNADGSYAWTQTFGGTASDRATAVATDGTSVYVTGALASTTAHIGAEGTAVSSAGGTDAFVIALNCSDGAAKSGWGRSGSGIQTFGGGWNTGTGVATDGTTVYVTGSFQGSAQIGVSGSGVISVGASYDAFVIALNVSDGAPKSGWGLSGSGVQTFGGTGADFAYGMATDGTSVYLTGSFQGSAQIGAAGFGVASAGGNDSFVIALNSSDGAARSGWGRSGSGIQTFGGTGDEIGFGVATDGASVYLTGSFQSGAQIGAAGTAASGAGGIDAFVIALNGSDGAAKNGWGRFGSGIQTFGGTFPDSGYSVATDGESVYATGYFTNSAQIGAAGTAASSAGGADAFVIALNVSDGAAKSDWGTSGSGIQTFGGANADYGFGVATSGANVYARGSCSGVDVGIGGQGAFDSTGFGGFLLALDKATGATTLPVFTSPLKTAGGVGTAFCYTFSVANSPTGFGAVNLPPGLRYAAGRIIGTPATAGTYSSVISATNADGTTTATLTITILVDQVADVYPPVIKGDTTQGQSLAIDLDGNRYVVGSFSGVQDFNPGPGTDAKYSVGNTDAFVTRFNADGSYAWTQTFGGTNNDAAAAVATDGTSVYVTGYFYSGNAQIGAAGMMISSAGSSDAFVIALNCSDGAPKSGWGRSGSGIQTFGGTNVDYGYGVTTDGTNVYLTGYFFGSAQIGAAGASISTTGASQDAFVIALNCSDGAAKSGWGLSGSGIQICGGTGVETGYGVATDGTSVYATGYFQGNTQIGGAGTAIGSGGGTDAFVIALNCSDGAPKSGWGRSGSGIQTFGGASPDYGYGVATDGTSVYATGYFTGVAQIGATGTAIGSAAGSQDAFVIALNASDGAGKSGWGRSGSGIQSFGGTGTDSGYGVATDGTSVYATGNFQGSAQIGAAGTTIGSAGIYDAFVIALNGSDGAAKSGWGRSGSGSQTFGGTNTDSGYGVATDGTDVHARGGFSSTDAGLGGLGPFDSTNFGGFLLALDKATGGFPLPVFTSPLKAAGGVGVAFSYSLSATNSPTRFGAASLPPGLSYAAGVISGTPTTAGTYSSVISATNAAGTTYAMLTITILVDQVANVYPPVIQGSANQGQSVAIDAAGNRYVVGVFSGVRDFNPGPGVDAKVGVGGSDVFVTRFNADGSYAWTQTFGGTADDYSRGVATDGTSVYVTGYVAGSAKIGAGVTAVASAGNYDAFVIALNCSDGAAKTGWGRLGSGIQTFGGAVNDYGYGVTTDGTSVYASGVFQGSGQIGAVGTAVGSAGGTPDAFVIALNASDGAAKSGWGLSGSGIQTFGGTSSDAGTGVATDRMSVYVTGEFSSANAQIGAAGTALGSAGGSQDAFVIALNGSDGAAKSGWGLLGSGIQTFGGTSSDGGSGVATDGTSVYATGNFSSSNAQIGAAGTAIGSAGLADAFVIALNASDGAAKSDWGLSGSGIQTFGGANGDGSYGVATDGTGVYATGNFNSANVQIGAAGPAISNAGSYDAFVIALNGSDGAAKTGWGRLGSGVQTFGGTGDDRGYGITADGTNIYARGGFSSTDAGVGGLGILDSTNFGGFLLTLDKTSGMAPSSLPVFTSPLKVAGGVGAAFTYMLSATNSPTGYDAVNLPPGFVYNAGAITGTPSAAGTYAATISATNAAGTTYATLAITIILDQVASIYPPVIQGDANQGQLVALDTSGNRYVVGNFSGVRDFNPGAGADVKLSLGSTQDVFVTRFNADGSYAWTQTFGGSGTDSGWGIATDGTSVYATGYTSSPNVQIGMSNVVVATAGSWDAFVIALNCSDGATKSGWGRSGSGIQTFGGSSDDRGYGIATDGTTVFATGYFTGSAQIGAAGAAIVSAGASDVFVIALNCSDGAPKSGWGISGGGIQTFGGTGSDFGYGLAVGGTNLYATGQFAGTAKIGAAGSGIASAGPWNAFVIALTISDGMATSGWGRSASGIQTFGGTTNDAGYGVATDGTSVYATGVLTSANAQIGAAGTAIGSTGGSQDAFIIALNCSDGASKSGWGRLASGIQTFGGTSFDYGYGVATDGTDVFATGYFNGSAQLGAAGTSIESVGGSQDAFVLALNASDGAAKSGWGRSGSGIQAFGGTNSDSGYGVVADATNVYVRGTFASTDAGIGGIGPFDSTNFGGFLLALDKSTGQSAHNLYFQFEGDIGGPIYRQRQNAPFNVRIAATDAAGQRNTAFNGTVTISSTGTLTEGGGTTATFTNGVLSSHTVNLSDAGTFLLRAQETSGGAGASNSFEVVADRAPVITENPGPVAITMDEDSTPSAFNLMLHATDLDGDTITWSISSAASHGTAAVGGTGGSKAIAYTPNANYNGSDSFTVQVSDGLGGTATIAANVTISPRNDPPNNTAVPTISGTPHVGQTLTANNGAWDDNTDLTPGTLSYSYQWQRANDSAGAGAADIPGATSGTYVLSSADNGMYVSVKVTATDNGEGLPAGQSTTAASVYVPASKTDQAISFAPLPARTYGDPAFDLSASASSGLTVAFNVVSGPATVGGSRLTLTGAGTVVVRASQPGNDVFNAAASTEQSLNVAKAQPVLTWSNPADIIYGNPLISVQLNATANVDGTFTYNPVAETVLKSGDGQSLSVSFTPADSANYIGASVSVMINVKAATAPAITSPLHASATLGSGFGYTIGATGSTPMTFSASGLPPGLTFSGDTISGSASVGGVVLVTLQATNIAGSESKTLRLTISRPDEAAAGAPSVSSGPAVDVKAAVTGQLLTFTVAATDPDGDIVGYCWDFGDGMTGTGASTTHVYAAPGIYSVMVGVSDGTLTTTKTFELVVSAAEAPVGKDNGGDDSWEAAALDEFAILKGALKLSFTDGNKDALQISGTLPVTKFFKPASKNVTVLIGGVKKDFTLNAKGQGTSGACKLQMKGKMKKGVFKVTPAKFTLSIKGEPLLAALKHFGFADTTTAKTGESHTLSAIMLVDVMGYEADKAILYKAKAGKAGSAK
ncbi:MAG TPA: PKD domain-containing protein [Planctomycetota bacterium]|jgi:hypothetical protein